MDQCKNCTILAGYPGVSIDETGLCGDCRAFSPAILETTVKVRGRLEKELVKALESVRTKKHKYHCIVALSGDKDSCYAAWMMAKKYKLNVLAVTVDTGFLLEQSYKNILYVTKKIGIDHVFIKERDFFKAIFNHAFSNHFFSRPQGLACFLSSKLIPNLLMAYAGKNNIPWVVSGDVDINAPQLFINTKEFILNKQTLNPSLLEMISRKTNKQGSTLFLHPLNTLARYSATKIIGELVQKVGLKEDQLSYEKTTSVIAIITMYMYQKIRGYNPYYVNICQQIRYGMIDKNHMGSYEALTKMANRGEIKEMVEYALKLIRADQLNKLPLKSDLYIPVLDDIKELNPKGYLQKNALDLGEVLRQPSLYYPGAGADFDPLKLFSSHSTIATFIYTDYAPENARQACQRILNNEIKEFEVTGSQRIVSSDLGCDSWKDFWPSAPGALKLSDPSEAFGLFVQLCLKEGHKKINFVYLCTEGIQTYKVLFSKRKIGPTVLVLQDHGISRNWDDFARQGSQLYVIARLALPTLLYAAAQPSWPGFKRVSEFGDEEGSGRNRRALYRRP